MKVQPVASPNAIQQAPSNDGSRKAAAIAAFNQATPTPAPQAHNHGAINQNAVSVEDLSAIQSGQSDTTVENVPSEATEAPQQPKAKTPEEEQASRRFAQLARQEKALRAKAQEMEQQYRQRDEAYRAKEAELTAKDNQYRQGYYSKDQIKQDAMTILADSGVSYDDLVQQIVSQTPQDPRTQSMISKLEAKIQSLEEQNKQTQKTYQDQQTQAYEAAVKQIRTDVKSLVFTDPTFETIKAMKATEDVVELIKQTFDKDGVLLTPEEAAQQVEDYLVERGLEVAKLKKIQQRIAQSSGSTAPKQTQGSTQTQTQPMKTLTNATSSNRQLTAKERAILAFKGEKF